LRPKAIISLTTCVERNALTLCTPGILKTMLLQAYTSTDVVAVAAWGTVCILVASALGYTRTFTHLRMRRARSPEAVAADLPAADPQTLLYEHLHVGNAGVLGVWHLMVDC
jgi:hypothetical protein